MNDKQIEEEIREAEAWEEDTSGLKRWIRWETMLCLGALAFMLWTLLSE